MSSISETGHYKNMANLDQLISAALGYREKFNPVKVSISINALQSKRAAVKTAFDAVSTSFPAFTNAVAERELAFAPLSKFVTRVFNSLKASSSSGRLDEAVKSLVRKIQGMRGSSRKKNTDVETSPSGEIKISISSSQMSYDNRLDNFDKLIKYLAALSYYAPNEEDLKVSSLTALYDSLKTKNDAVIAAEIPLSNARLARNKELYEENTGLVDVAADVKSYIKSVFGATSPEFRQVSGLRFTRPR